MGVGVSADVAVLGRWARLQRKGLALLGFRSMTRRRIGDIELTPEEAQKLGQIAGGTTRQYTFPPRIERLFQDYVRENSRAARLSLVGLTAGVYLSLPLWISLLGVPPESVRMMTVVSLGFIAPLFLAVTFIQARFLATDFAEWLLVAAMMFEAIFVEVVRHRTEVLGYFVEPSISVLVPVAVIAMARLRISLNFLFIAVYFLMLASQPFWWSSEMRMDNLAAWGMNVVLLLMLMLSAALQKEPLQTPLLIRLRRAFNIFLTGFYFLVLIFEALRWPDEIRSRGQTGWPMEILLLTIVMLAAVWSKLSSRRQWAANALLQLMAYRDSLTGLPNRRAFEDHYERVSRALARSHSNQMVLAILDLDQFKKLNDDYGHDYGDGALAEIALTLTHFARRSLDICARMGGEEFALLLYDCDAENGRRRLGELVEAIADMKIENRAGVHGVLTCSIGAVVVRPNELLGDTYRQADELLYQVKSAGRNNFALAD
jgi:diguanylate cyclase (GGDEF)-like protein